MCILELGLKVTWVRSSSWFDQLATVVAPSTIRHSVTGKQEREEKRVHWHLEASTVASTCIRI